MGITVAALRLLAARPLGRVLSLSYPDMVMSQDDLQRECGFRTQRETQHGRWHGRDHPLPETEEVFARLGATSWRFVDIVASRGVEEIRDLNEPQEFGEHDTVIDPGTTEHCANFWQATLNAAHAVAPGGRILHTPPLTMTNHGFVCPQPTFYWDLYSQNGWEVECLAASNGLDVVSLHPTKRVQLPAELSLYVVARRRTDAALRAPTQTKYLNNPSLK
ncbi:MAG TPA: hypothetical protein PKD87_11830 [Burkholderiaceae bacterium]|nr:hypothetical protein [Burkholderiaceae bacterium]